MIKGSNTGKMIVASAILVLMVTGGYLMVLSPKPMFTKSGFVLGPQMPYEKSFVKSLTVPSKFVRYASSNAIIDITIGLKWSNETELKENLRSMSDTSSPNYQRFYTWDDFKKRYSPSKEIYNSLIYWLKNNGLYIKHTYPLRNAVTISDRISKIEHAFGVKFGVYRGDGIHTRKYYYAPMGPINLPQNLMPYISGVDGLTSANIFHTSFWTTSDNDSASQILYGQNAPHYVRGLAGADLEYLYGAVKLFNNSATGNSSSKHILPTKIRVATVLWEGTNSTGYQFAPFDPQNVRDYYNDVTPNWIQNILNSETGKSTSEFGWYSPNPNASEPSSDVDGMVNVENELDMEMVGTLAPGVNVTLVYSNGSWYQPNPLYGMSVPGESDFPDQEYNYILNTLAQMTDRTLVAVTNSWGGPGNYTTSASDSVTMQDVEALNAMGITVMAASGDGGNTTPSWPAEATWNTYGFLAIGGTTLVPNGVDNSDSLPADVPLKAENLDKNNPRFAEYVWYDIVQSLFGTQTSGTECGVTSAYPEPSWQNDTIGAGKGGRVTADIGAIANRTIILTSIQSLFGLESHVWYTQSGGIAGTSVASPVVAGLFADMAAYVGREYGWQDSGIRGFGFIAPTIYHLGYDYYVKGMYASTPPFFDVKDVYPSRYPAPPAPGYDMPTGWGVIDAWNFVHDIGFRITSVQNSITVNPGQSGIFNLKVWFPYGWNTSVGYFRVYGLPSGTTATFSADYVNPPSWSSNTTANNNLNLQISTGSNAPLGTYIIYVVGYTYNITTGHHGNLTYNLSLTLNIGNQVPEFSGSINIMLVIITMLIGTVVYKRRRN